MTLMEQTLGAEVTLGKGPGLVSRWTAGWVTAGVCSVRATP